MNGYSNMFQMCTEVESTRMICLTPKIDIPPELNHTRTVDQGDSISPLARSKRETPDEILEYYLGFIQDGFDGYRDLREGSLKDKAFLTIIEKPPKIEKWDAVQKREDGDSITIEVFKFGLTEYQAISFP